MPAPSQSESISPTEVIQRLADALPESCRENVVVIGSLAAGYRYFSKEEDARVQTKDIDCLLRPFVEALTAGRAITNTLLESGWEYSSTEEFPTPGNDSTPDEKLPVVRLAPPGGASWFVELLTVAENEDGLGKAYLPLKTDHGRFSLCAFGGIRLAQWEPIKTKEGIAIARPEMMALSNLLHHKKIGDEPMSKAIGGRSIKRSNKDLGRVLALAYLAEREQEDALLEWPVHWREALEVFFPKTWTRLAADCGNGLRALLTSRNDLVEAHHTCQHGLVAALGLSLDTLRSAGERLLVDAIEPLEKEAGNRPKQ